MSTNSFPFPNYKYKSNTLRNHSYNPKIVNFYDTSTMKVGHYTKKKPTLISINGMPSYTQTSNYFILTPDKYIYQDECPDSNVIFFNSNLQKYRIDSLGRKQIIDSSPSKLTEKYYTSNTFKKWYNEDRPNKTLNYSLNLNQPGNEYRRNVDILSNKNRIISNDNILSHGRMNHSENLSVNQNKSSYGKNDQKGKIYTSQNKSSYSYSSNRINNLNPNQDKKMSYNQIKNMALYNNKTEQNKYQFQNDNQKGNNDNRRFNYSTYNKNDNNINIRKDILNNVDLNKKESKFGQNKDNLFNDNRRRKPYQSKESKENNNYNYNLRDAKTTLLNTKENANLREDNKSKDNKNLKNDEYLNSKDTNNKENKQIKENRFSRKYQNQINQNSLNNLKNYKKDEKLQQFSDNKNNNINPNINQENQNQNVKIFNKTEEKTIVVLPGQTIEPKTINETFEKPIIETIKNEDGTTSSVIKQTKITTISENVPIGNEKIKSIEGAPDLPMVKQYITYEYKTVSSPREGKIMANQILKPQNKVFEEDKLYSDNKDMKKSEEKRGNKNNNLNFENYGDNNKGIQGDNYLQSSLKEKQLGEDSAKKRLGLSKNKNEKLYDQYKEGNGNKRIGLSGKRGNAKSEGKNMNDIKSRKKQEGINQFSESLKKSKNRKGIKSIEKSGKNREDMKNIEKSDKNSEGIKSSEKADKNLEGMKSLEKADKNLKGLKSIEKSDKNREGIKSLEKTGKNLEKSNKNTDKMKNLEKSRKNENKDLNKKSVDDKNNKLAKAIAAVDNTFKENLKKLSEGPQTKEEKLIIDIIKKGENIAPEEKQKIFKFLSDLYGKCSQKENKDDKEKTLEKLGLYLSSLRESERKDILPKLKNIFPDNEELYKKLIDIISKKYCLKPKEKKADKHETNSLNKNIFNMDIENKNIKKKIGKKLEGIKGYNDFSQNLHLDFKFRDYPEKVSFVHGELSSPLLKGNFSETIEIKSVNPLKFDGLFLEISKYESIHREKNPFEGPSPFNKFYKVRKSKIRKKINTMANEEINDEKMDDKKEK